MRSLILVSLLLSGCTYANVNLETGEATVWTFATSRQAADIGRNADGSVHWLTQGADATSVLAQVIVSLAKLVPPPVVP